MSFALATAMQPGSLLLFVMCRLMRIVTESQGAAPDFSPFQARRRKNAGAKS
jgi:hypothetical protein